MKLSARDILSRTRDALFGNRDADHWVAGSYTTHDGDGVGRCINAGLKYAEVMFLHDGYTDQFVPGCSDFHEHQVQTRSGIDCQQALARAMVELAPDLRYECDISAARYDSKWWERLDVAELHNILVTFNDGEHTIHDPHCGDCVGDVLCQQGREHDWDICRCDGLLSTQDAMNEAMDMAEKFLLDEELKIPVIPDEQALMDSVLMEVTAK